MAKQKPQRTWVSLSKRRPPRCEDIIVRAKSRYGWIEVAGASLSVDGIWRYYCDGCLRNFPSIRGYILLPYRPTHWRDMPRPPKKVKHG